MNDFNIKYVVTGRTDGRWMIQAYDRNDKPISANISCGSVKDAMRIWLMLNGYASPRPVLDSKIESNMEAA